MARDPLYCLDALGVDDMTQSISGMLIQADYIDAETEAALIQKIDTSPWNCDLRRRTQHYGFRYDYRARSASAATQLGPLPHWVAELTHRVKKDFAIALADDQIIVNEYQPGQGIAAHIDCPKSFAEPIISLSLGTGIELELSCDGALHRLYLEPRSVLVLAGEARFQWRHGIRPRKSDLVDGKRRIRARRLSITFRWLNKQD